MSVPSIQSCKGWVVEDYLDQAVDLVTSAKFEFPEEMGQQWFKENFAHQKDLKHFVGFEQEFGPLIISLFLDSPKSSSNKNSLYYKALIRSQEVLFIIIYLFYYIFVII